MKKFLALFLSLVMTLTMGITAFAADEYQISTKTDDSHTYEVYQIFTGDLSGGVLSNVKWGQNAKNNAEQVNSGTPVPENVLSELASISNTADDQTKLTTILKYAELNSNAISEVKKDSPYTAAPGYYLIKDKTITAGTDDAYTTYIVKVVGDVTIERKDAKPTVDKQVQDEEDDAEVVTPDDGKHVNGWGETADHAINESFQFKLTATLTADPDYADYKTYKIVFHDSWSEGVTYDGIESVYVNDTKVELNSGDNPNGYEIAVGDSKREFTITIADIIPSLGSGKKLADGVTIVVTYNAHLNENAVIGNDDDNKNTVYLEYSNNPNGEGLGETAPDTVYVFTYQIENIKVEPDEGETAANATKPLNDAGFRLYSDAACTTEINLVYDTTMGAYRRAKTGETPVEMKSPENGKFVIKGLDTGTYYIKETTTPAGYNTCPVLKIEITAEHHENSTGAETIIKMNGNDPAENKFVNTKGTTLPETGGIGTTIFYVIGGLLMAGAVVLLVTKKKMEAKND